MTLLNASGTPSGFRSGGENHCRGQAAPGKTSRSWLRKIFACCKCGRRARLKAEEIVVPVVVYSEGESGEEENRLGRKFLKMKEREKDLHTRKLWSKLLIKAKGASLVNSVFEGLKRRMYLFGTSTKLKFKIARQSHRFRGQNADCNGHHARKVNVAFIV